MVKMVIMVDMVLVLASPYTLEQTWEKKCAKPSWQAFTPPPPLQAMPIYGNDTY